MRYAVIVDASRRVADTPKRGEKVALLADVLRSTPPALAATVVGLLVGEPRQGRFGVGWATLRDALVLPAAEAVVTVEEVDRTITVMAELAGEGSQRSREEVLIGLLGRLTAAEQAHLSRLIGGEMRQGANDGVVADAIAKAAGVAAADVRRAAMLLGDLGGAAGLALAGERLDVGLSPLVGVQPMLAGTAASVSDALALTGPASVEWKLDGARVQVHRAGDEVRVFTRSLHEIAARIRAARPSAE